MLQRSSCLAVHNDMLMGFLKACVYCLLRYFGCIVVTGLAAVLLLLVTLLPGSGGRRLNLKVFYFNLNRCGSSCRFFLTSLTVAFCDRLLLRYTSYLVLPSVTTIKAVLGG